MDGKLFRKSGRNTPSYVLRPGVAFRIGVYVTHDGGDWWRPFDDGLPRVTVGGMSFRKVTRTLYLATEGRGVFSRKL